MSATAAIALRIAAAVLTMAAATIGAFFVLDYVMIRSTGDVHSPMISAVLLSSLAVGVCAAVLVQRAFIRRRRSRTPGGVHGNPSTS
jgi:hypothetical protein